MRLGFLDLFYDLLLCCLQSLNEFGVFSNVVFLAGCCELVLFNTEFQKEFIEALVFFNSHHMLFSFRRDLLLTDSHVNSKLSLNFLLFHDNGVLNALLFSDITLRSGIHFQLSGTDSLLDFLDSSLHGLVDLRITLLLELALSSLELVWRAPSSVKNVLLNFLHVLIHLRLRCLDDLGIPLHVACLHEVSADGGNRFVVLAYRHLS